MPFFKFKNDWKISDYLATLSDSSNLGQNIWNKVKESTKIGQEHKTLKTATAKYLAAITKVLFLEGRPGTRCYLHLILTFS